MELKLGEAILTIRHISPIDRTARYRHRNLSTILNIRVYYVSIGSWIKSNLKLVKSIKTLQTYLYLKHLFDPVPNLQRSSVLNQNKFSEI